jgi:hypothetical protein
MSMTHIPDFPEITLTFSANMQALRVFNQQIGTMADEHDRIIIKEFVQKLVNLDIRFTESMTDEHLSRLGFTSPSEAARLLQSKGLAARSRPRDHTDFHNQLSHLLVQNPDKTGPLLMLIKSFVKQAPSQGPLLRRGALLVLIAYFRTLLSHIIQAYYVRYPSKFLSLLDDHDMRAADTSGPEETNQFERVIQEVDSVLKRRLEEQVSYMVDQLGVDLHALVPHMDSLIELVQRRNLFLHSDGIVNDHYLDRVPQSYIVSHNIRKDQQLLVGAPYLSRAIDLMYLAGTILTQQCWRAWEPNEHSDADNFMTQCLYETLGDQRYELAAALGSYGGGLSFANLRSARVVAIDRAIALKELGRHDEMEQLLSSYDWSSSTTEFRLALHVLRDEEDEFFQLLPQAISEEVIGCHELREWPLFCHLRQKPRFVAIMEQYFSLELPHDIHES